MRKQKNKEQDPAFLFYPAEASEDTQFMNRLERGCYFDILKAQKKFKKFSIDQIKKVLGRDFDECWPSLEIVLKKDENGFYFIEWVDNSIEKRKEYSENQRKRIQDYWDKKKQSDDIPRNNHGITDEVPYGNGNGIIDKEGLENNKTIAVVGSERVKKAANEAWDDGIWRENICMGGTVKNMDELKRWMGRYNASICNDVIANFSTSAYKKMFQNWVSGQIAKGVVLPDDTTSRVSNSAPLKRY